MSYNFENPQRKVWFPIVCCDCKKESTVPFNPKPDKPVYCRECYAKRHPERRTPNIKRNEYLWRS